MSAGASAVAIGCQNLIDPYACKKIIEDLEPLLNQLGIAVSVTLGESFT